MVYEKTSFNPKSWANDNFNKIFLGDRRRVDRLKSLAEKMAKNPGVSIPNLADDWSETKAIYSLLKNKHLRPDMIQANHRINVENAIQNSSNDVLLLEDASEFQWNGKKTIEGLGPVGSGREKDQGFILQSTLAVEYLKDQTTTSRETGNTARSAVNLLGLADQQYYIRPPKRESTKRRRDTTEPLETDLWRNTLERINQLSTKKKRIIRVCDRGADIYEVLAETINTGYDFVIRGRHNRILENDVNEETIRLFDDVKKEKPACLTDLFLRTRGNVPARIAKLNISFKKVNIRAPGRPGHKAGDLPGIIVTVVRVWEENPPVGQERIEWFLMTSLPTDHNFDLLYIVEIYTTRWIIEDYHKAIKTGLGAEELQLQSAHALMATIAIMSVVALRLVDLRERVRIMPDGPPEESGFDDFELKILSIYTKRELKTLRCVALAVGRLGGHLNRKSDGMPGLLTLWKGMTKLLELVEGAQIGIKLNSDYKQN